MTNILNILNYNVWFSSKDLKQRTLNLIQLIKEKNPDIITLQEVRQDIYDILKESHPEYKYCYPKEIYHKYGNIIMSKHEILESNIFKYTDTKMERNLVIIKINYNNTNIHIATSHFESIFNNYNDIKHLQYQEAAEILLKYDNLIFTCDSNCKSILDKQYFNLYFKKYNVVQTKDEFDKILYTPNITINTSSEILNYISDHHGLYISI